MKMVWFVALLFAAWAATTTISIVSLNKRTVDLEKRVKAVECPPDDSMKHMDCLLEHGYTVTLNGVRIKPK